MGKRISIWVLLCVIGIVFPAKGVAVDSEKITVNNGHLLKFSQQHTRQFNLSVIDSKNSKPTPKQDRLEIYLYNSIEYVQLCYEANNNTQSLPLLLKSRSYRPIQQQIVSSSVKCYQILNKLSLIEQPELVFQEDPQGSEGQKKYKKENQFLRNQQQLAKWLHAFGRQTDSNLAKDYKSTKLQLNGLRQFSLYISLSKDGQFSIINAWMQNEKTQKTYKMSKKLHGKGLHQKVVYAIQLSSGRTAKKQLHDINSQQCHVQLLETLPHSTYIDVDELQGHGFNVLLEEGQSGDGIKFINVEKPAYQSRQYQYELRVPWSAWTETQMQEFQIELPVHFRYPTPYHLEKKQENQKAKQYRKQYVEVQLYPTTKMTIVCSTNEGVHKYRVHEDYLIEKGTALIPVGDGQMKSAVNLITLGSEIMCAVLLVRQLRK